MQFLQHLMSFLPKLHSSNALLMRILRSFPSASQSRFLRRMNTSPFSGKRLRWRMHEYKITREDLRKGLNNVTRQDWFTAARKLDRKSTRLNSSHSQISYAVFCF